MNHKEEANINYIYKNTLNDDANDKGIHDKDSYSF
jgi:hypothetical protein